MKHRFALFLLLSSVATGAAFFVACSSDDPIDIPTTDGGGKDAAKDTTTNEDTGSDTDTGTKTDSSTPDAAQNCAKLRPRSPLDAGPDADGGYPGVFCPSSKPNPDGGTRRVSSNCDRGLICFDPPTQPDFTNTCEPSVTDVDGGVNWVCNGQVDCAGGQVCCGLGAIAGTSNSDCPSQPRPAGYKGTRCQATCNPAMNEFQICESQGECKAGTCTPFTRFSSELGACL